MYAPKTGLIINYYSYYYCFQFLFN